MSITPPKSLYRFRPLDDNLLKRELEALEKSYVYSPPFAAMNDPMEAFYETGGPGDFVVDLMLQGPRRLADIYKMLDDLLAKFALISFTGTHMDLPMWAYYGSNFAGMCLEFDSEILRISDLQNEALLPVTYAETALPPIGFEHLGDNIDKTLAERITRKRIEWAHEKEWRFITGAVGPKHYRDDALRRVYLGPRVSPDHARQVCAVLANRPVEILQGRIKGYELRFEPLQAGKPLQACERIGSGRFDRDDFYLDDLLPFFDGNLDPLWAYCEALLLHPNLEAIDDIAPSGSTIDAIYIWSRYRLRSGRDVYHKTLLDKDLRVVQP
jgi:hypothetical protein